MSKESSVAEMVVKEGEIKHVKWSWRRRLFRWEEELAEVCESLILGAINSVEGEDRWKRGESVYTV